MSRGGEGAMMRPGYAFQIQNFIRIGGEDVAKGLAPADVITRYRMTNLERVSLLVSAECNDRGIWRAVQPPNVFANPFSDEAQQAIRDAATVAEPVPDRLCLTSTKWDRKWLEIQIGEDRYVPSSAVDAERQRANALADAAGRLRKMLSESREDHDAQITRTLDLESQIRGLKKALQTSRDQVIKMGGKPR